MIKTTQGEEWAAARVKFLEREKAFTMARDEPNRARRELPWEKVAKDFLRESHDAEAFHHPKCSLHSVFTS